MGLSPRNAFIFYNILLSIAYSRSLDEDSTTVTYTDLSAAKRDLQSARSAWQARGITNYVYHNEALFYGYGCSLVPTYLVIEDDKAVYGEYDQEWIEDNKNWMTEECTDLDLRYSRSMDFYFESAINFVEREIQNPTCGTGTSIAFGLDPKWGYLNYLKPDSGDCIADADTTNTFKCLTIFEDEPLPNGEYVNETRQSQMCTKFLKYPILGNECEEPDCAKCGAPCAKCSDANGNEQEWGCCGCHWQMDKDDKLMCSSFTPREAVCPNVDETPSPINDNSCQCTPEYTPLCCSNDERVYTNECNAQCKGGYNVTNDCHEVDKLLKTIDVCPVACCDGDIAVTCFSGVPQCCPNGQWGCPSNGLYCGDKQGNGAIKYGRDIFGEVCQDPTQAPTTGYPTLSANKPTPKPVVTESTTKAPSGDVCADGNSIEIVSNVCSFCYGAEKECGALAVKNSNWLDEMEGCFEKYCGFDSCIVEFADGFDESNVDGSCDLGCDLFKCKDDLSAAYQFGIALPFMMIIISYLFM